MNDSLEIRRASIADIEEIKQLFKETVLTVNAKDYNADEIVDWASCGDDMAHLEDLISNLYFIVAERSNDGIVGIASIRNDGYLHTMFIHKNFLRQGIASLLYNEIENYARNNGIERILSEVSITAKGFFEKQGFFVEKEQKRKMNKLHLTNYMMVKDLVSI